MKQDALLINGKKGSAPSQAGAFMLSVPDNVFQIICKRLKTARACTEKNWKRREKRRRFQVLERSSAGPAAKTRKQERLQAAGLSPERADAFRPDRQLSGQRSLNKALPHKNGGDRRAERSHILAGTLHAHDIALPDGLGRQFLSYAGLVGDRKPSSGGLVIIQAHIPHLPSEGALMVLVDEKIR